MEKTYRFTDRAEAWRFMRQCSTDGIPAGYPQWDESDGTYTVRILFRED